jgi:hypothetical protein
MAKLGRPRKPIADGERCSLGLRVTASIKRLVEAAADGSGRSVSQEVEHRLERSFRDDEVLRRLDAIEARLGDS